LKKQFEKKLEKNLEQRVHRLTRTDSRASAGPTHPVARAGARP